MEWLLKSVLTKLLWPRPKFKRKRAITAAEHTAIIAREKNPERRYFYELLWHTGASQSDATFLSAEDINWPARTIAYTRQKLARLDPAHTKPALIRFGDEVARLLGRRPQSGPLFPYLRTVRPGDRATEFHQRCQELKIQGVSLHSYRYAWAGVTQGSNDFTGHPAPLRQILHVLFRDAQFTTRHSPSVRKFAEVFTNILRTAIQSGCHRL